MPKLVNIPEDELRELIGRGLSKKHLAEYYKCSVATITNKMKAYGITYEGNEAGEINEHNGVLDVAGDTAITIDENDGILCADNSVKLTQAAFTEHHSVIAEITKLSPAVKYEIEDGKLVLYNNSGEVTVAPSSFVSVSTGIGVKFFGGLGLISLINNESRYITIVNPIIDTCDEVSVVIANYHPIDTYTISNNTPIAVMNIMPAVGAEWREA